jgi:hypothetical protein
MAFAPVVGHGATGRLGTGPRLGGVPGSDEALFPAHRMEVYRSYAHGALRVTEELYEQLLCISLYNDLTDHSIDAIAAHIHASLRHTSARRASLPSRRPRPELLVG